VTEGESRLLLADSRGRVSLIHVVKHPGRKYLVQEYRDGTLVLTPAITIEASEAASGKQARG
jgi:predicted metal-dependent enzyme (double-stranded beta helix superfamily)